MKKQVVGKVWIKYCSLKNHVANFCPGIRNSVAIRIFRSTFLVPQLRKLGFFFGKSDGWKTGRDLLLSAAEPTVKRECEMQCGRARADLPRPKGRASDAGWLAAGQSVHTSFLLSHVQQRANS